MKLPLRAWKRTWNSLGFVVREQRQPRGKRPSNTSFRSEQLEQRVMLDGDNLEFEEGVEVGPLLPPENIELVSPTWPPEIAGSDHTVWPEPYQDVNGEWIFPSPFYDPSIIVASDLPTDDGSTECNDGAQLEQGGLGEDMPAGPDAPAEDNGGEQIIGGDSGPSQQPQVYNANGPDIVLTSFTRSTLSGLKFDYTVSTALSQSVKITLYASENTSSVSVNAPVLKEFTINPSDLTAGSHTLTVDTVDALTELATDYYLVAKVDADDVIDESSETNNELGFAGGVFKAGDVVYVHGVTSPTNETVSLSQSTNLTVTFGTPYTFSPATSVSGIHIRMHDGNDTVNSSSSVSKETWIFGGAGNDSIASGGGIDYLYGGAGDDTYNFGSGVLSSDFVFEAGYDEANALNFSSFSGNVDLDLSRVDGNVMSNGYLVLSVLCSPGHETEAIRNVTGSNQIDNIHGNKRANSIYGGNEDDMLFGGDGDDYLDGGGGYDHVYGEGGSDSFGYSGYPSNDFYSGGEGTDYFSIGFGYSGTGIKTMDGGPGNDVYTVSSTAWGTNIIVEPDSDTDVDTINFAAMYGAGPTGININLNSTATQSFSTGSSSFTLQLSSTKGIENVIGTNYADTITANSQNNVLQGGSGGDTYIFPSTAGSIWGNDEIIDTSSYSSAYDTLNFTGFAGRVTFDLRLNTSQSVNSNQFESPMNLKLTNGGANFRYIYGSNNGNTLYGTDYDNYLIGGAGVDSLYGNGGNDYLEGAGGNDYLAGGDGNDTFDAAGAANGGDDQIFGEAGNDTLYVGAGDDTLDGGTGDDTYVFQSAISGHKKIYELAGLGSDTLDFGTSTSGVTLDLSSAAYQPNVVGSVGVTLITSNTNDGIENLKTGSGNDTLTGNSRSNILQGGSGNDTYRFVGTGALGTDTITEFSGGGTDTLDFSALTANLNLNLNTSSQQTVAIAPSLNVTLGSSTNYLENVIGGSGNDSLTGNSLNNILNGGAGWDTLTGNAGDDVLIADLPGSTVAGTNTLNGGAGKDTYQFSPTSVVSTNLITETGTDIDTLDFSNFTTGVSADLSVSSFIATPFLTITPSTSSSLLENIVGGTGNDTLTGNSAVNVLTGGLGDDVLVGGQGSDTLAGGTGADRYWFTGNQALGSDSIVDTYDAFTNTLDFTGVTGNPSVDYTSLTSQAVIQGFLDVTLLQPANWNTPELAVSSPTIVEGQGGSIDAVFVVTRLQASSLTLTATYSTANGSATSNSDYLQTTGNVTFLPNETTKNVTIPVNGDATVEPNETFTLTLSNSRNTVLVPSLSTGTALIVNDDTTLGPTIASLTANPTPVLQSVPITLTANGVATSSQSISEVKFYVDVNGDFAVDPATDIYLGNGTANAATWSLLADSSLMPVGEISCLAQAIDNLQLQTVARVTVTVLSSILDTEAPTSTYLETGVWSDSSSSQGVTTNARIHAAGTGTSTAQWTYSNIPAGTYELFARWTPEVGAASNSRFEVRNGTDTLTTKVVDQSDAPHSKVIDGFSWQSLGVVTTAAGNLSILLTDNADGLVIADAVRVVRTPVVRFATATSNGSDIRVALSEPVPFGITVDYEVVPSDTTLNRSTASPEVATGTVIIQAGEVMSSPITNVLLDTQAYYPGLTPNVNGKTLALRLVRPTNSVLDTDTAHVHHLITLNAAPDSLPYVTIDSPDSYRGLTQGGRASVSVTLDTAHRLITDQVTVNYTATADTNEQYTLEAWDPINNHYASLPASGTLTFSPLQSTIWFSVLAPTSTSFLGTSVAITLSNAIGANIGGNATCYIYMRPTPSLPPTQYESSTGHVLIDVRSVAVSSVDDAFSINKDTMLTRTGVNGVLANDAVASGNATLVTNVQHGTLTLNSDGGFSYVPASGYLGLDSFTYSPAPLLPPATVFISVGDAQQIDILANDYYSIAAGTTLARSAALGVYSNDRYNHTPVTRSQLVTAAQHGTVTLQDDGSFTYEPDPGFSGLDTFDYALQHSDPAATSTTLEFRGALSTRESTGEATLDMVLVGGNISTHSNTITYSVSANLPSGPVTQSIVFPPNSVSQPLHLSFSDNNTWNDNVTFAIYTTVGFPFASTQFTIVDDDATYSLGNIESIPLGSLNASMDLPSGISVDLYSGALLMSHDLGDGHELFFNSLTVPSATVATYEYTGTDLGSLSTITKGQQVSGGLFGATRTLGPFQNPTENKTYVANTLPGTGHRRVQLSAAKADPVAFEWDVVDWTESVFGRNWSLRELSRLYFDPSGVLLVEGDGVARWFSRSGESNFTAPAGEFSTLQPDTWNDVSVLTLTAVNGAKTHFDQRSGLMLARVEPSGHITKYEYVDSTGGDVPDDLSKVIDPFGREMTFIYAAGHVKEIVDYAGRVTRLAIASTGQLRGILDPSPDDQSPSAAPLTHYDDWNAGELIIASPTNDVIAVSYYGGSAARVWSVSSRTELLIYSAVSHRLYAPYPSWSDEDTPFVLINGTSNVYFATDALGNITSTRDALGHVTTYERDGNGVLLSATDEYTDASGQPQQIVTSYPTHDTHGHVTAAVLPGGLTRAWSYDALFGVMTMYRDEYGVTTRWGVDPSNGNVTWMAKTVGTDDPSGPNGPTGDDIVTHYTYNSTDHSLLETIVSPDPDLNDATINSVTTKLAYYSATDGQKGRRGLVQSIIRAFGTPLQVQELFDYDQFGNLHDYRDGNGNQTINEYDRLNRLVLTSLPDPESGSATGYTNTYRYKYDARGRVVTVTDPLQHVTTRFYDEWSRPVVEISQDPTSDEPGGGQVTKMYYTGARSNLSAAYLPNGAIINYAWDDFGRLTKQSSPAVTLPEGATQYPTIDHVIYEYDALNRVTKETGPLGNVNEVHYDAVGNIATITHSAPGTGDYGTTTTEYRYAYPGTANYVDHYFETVTDASGAVTQSDYDGLHRLTVVHQPSPVTGAPTGSTTSYGYDRLDRVTSETDAMQRVTNNRYDVLDRLEQVTRPDPDEVAGSNGPLMPPVYKYEYDSNGNVLKEIDATNEIVTEHRYDHLNREKELRLPNPVSGQPTHVVTDEAIGPVTRFTYDLIGNVLTERDSDGNVTDYEYDNIYRLITNTLPDPDGSNGIQESTTLRYTYDLTGKQRNAIDALGGVTQQLYGTQSGQQLLIAEIAPDPDGFGPGIAPRTDYTYDKEGNVATTLGPDIDGAGPLSRPLTMNQYDSHNHLIRTTAPAPDAQHAGPVTEYHYNANGQLVRQVNPPIGSGFTNPETIYEYDKLGRTTKVTLPDPDGPGGTQVSPWTVTTYYDSGQVQSKTDRLNHATTYFYDNLDRLIRQQDAIGKSTLYGFDQNGDRTKLTDPNGNVTTYGYDKLHRLTSDSIVLDGVNRDRTYMYSLDGDQIQAVDRNGLVRKFEYDNLHRQTAEKWFDNVADANANANVRNTYNFSYNSNDALLSAGNAAATYSYHYDGADRPDLETQQVAGLGSTISFARGYDPAGNLKSLVATMGTVTDFVNSYSYDNLNRLAQVKQEGVPTGHAIAPKRVDFTYDAASMPDLVKRYADLPGAQLVATSQYQFDQAGRLKGLNHTKTGGNIENFTYGYDSASRLTSSTSTVDFSNSFGYDNRDQLLSATHSTQPNESYQYDSNGNRINNGSTPDVYNRLHNDAQFDYYYDYEGNLKSKTQRSTGIITEYTWDNRQRLTRVLERPSAGSPPTRQSDYTYDVFNRRIAKNVDMDGNGNQVPVATKYVFDGQDIVLSLNSTGQVTHRYLYSPAVDQVLSDEDATGQVLWPVLDNLGSVHDLVDSSGVVKDHINYDSFGNIVTETNPSLDYLFGFTGYERDRETGLLRADERYYSSFAGRFLSEDPIQDGSNWFAYVGNSPTNATDPRGLYDESIMLKALEILDPKVYGYWRSNSVRGQVETREATGLSTFWRYNEYGEMRNGQPFVVVDQDYTEGQVAAAIVRASSEGLFADSMAAHYQKHKVLRYNQTEDFIAWRKASLSEAADSAAALAEMYVKGAVGWTGAGDIIVNLDDVSERGVSWNTILAAVPLFAHMLPKGIDALNIKVASKTGTKELKLGQEAVEDFKNLSRQEQQALLKGAIETGDATRRQGHVIVGELDELGRPTGIRATVTPEMLGTGTDAAQRIRPPGFGGQAAGHARAHLLGKQLGGSGTDVRNLVTMFQNPANSPVMRDWENKVASVVRRGQSVDYWAIPIYRGTGPTPVGVTLRARGTGGFNLDVSIINKGN